MLDTKRTCTTSIRYSGRKLPRVVILCWESLVGVESTVTSTLSIAQILSMGGFSTWDMKKISSLELQFQGIYWRLINDVITWLKITNATIISEALVRE